VTSKPASAAAPSISSSVDEQEIKAEQIRLGMAAMPKIALYGSCAITVVASLLVHQAAGGSNLKVIAAWTLAMYLSQVAALVSGRRFAAGPRHDLEFVANYINRHDKLTLCIGALWGCTSWLFVKPERFETNNLLDLVVGLVMMGYASVEGPYRRGTTLFTLSTVLVYALGLVWVGGTFQFVVALVFLILGAAVLDFSRVQETWVRRAIQFGIEADKLRAIAESASRGKTRFLASASHDLRQPIHTLALFVEALYLRPLDEATRAITGHMRTATQSLSTQLDALLDISKLDASVVQVHTCAVPLDGLMTRLSDEYQPAAQRKGLTLTWQGDVQACVHADPLHLERIVRNLIDNAIKYTSQGGVTISATRHGDLWVLAVRDTGCGIAAHDQARVFEEFYQVGNPHRDRTLGMGLGLSIVARLAGLLGVRIGLQSEPGVGTTFSLHLAAADQQAAASAPTRADHAKLIGLKVLVVDDEQSVRLAMQSLLEGLGCKVRLASGLGEALSDSSRPDIALVDFRLAGGEDGIATITSLRQRFPDLPAMLISGDVAPERLRQAHESGLILLHKPVLLNQLVSAMTQCCDGPDPMG
jgi:signal transduction histidine kinase/CheY-like chemotaxis protein